MSEIRSISEGTFVIGDTNGLTFEAGPGISVSQPSEGTVRIANDETVLWSGTASGVNATMNLSESYTNFERLRFVIDEGNPLIPYYWSEVSTNGSFLYPSFLRTNSSSAEVAGLWTLGASNNGTTLTIQVAVIRTNGGTQSANNMTFRKIVGINRISGSNA